MRKERVMAVHAAFPFNPRATETPGYRGRAIWALASDPEILRKSGGVFTVGDMACEDIFPDLDRRQPPPFRSRATSA
jgi:hypothetical protein